ncbi:MAG: hypothetical protein ABSH53_18400 [Holophaga sp.]|jgi:hypothetical protein
MKIHQTVDQMPKTPSRISGNATSLPGLAQPSFQGGDSFAAILHSLSDPASPASSRYNVPNAAILGGNNGLGPAITVLMAYAGHGAALLVHQASATTSATATRVTNNHPAFLAFTRALPDAETVDGGGTSVVSPNLAAPNRAADEDADRSAIRDSLPATLAADRITAAKAAINTGHAATSAAYAIEVTEGLAQGSGKLAIDATAKFMGAGALGQADRLGYDQVKTFAATSSLQGSIPTVNGVSLSTALGTDIHNGPHYKTLAQDAKAHASTKFGK